MSHYPVSRKALYLSEEETQALLDLCMTSSQETNALHDRAIMRLSTLLRGFLSQETDSSDTWTEADSEKLREHFGTGEIGTAHVGGLGWSISTR